MNGHLSQRIGLQRGVRQGCPLSPTLYVFYVHAFVTHMSKSSKFSGLNIPGQQCKVSAYADDLVMFCSDRQDEEYIFSSFDEVSVATGSTLNKGKTNILHIGPRPFSTNYERKMLRYVEFVSTTMMTDSLLLAFVSQKWKSELKSTNIFH